ncbi:MAG: helix-turn-helix domain-containing protein [Candidatus Cloacimonetes bacterium]|nr:helix-turn-helix domain-containing protein [Candidatus Cloacimonadota bacterium]
MENQNTEQTKAPFLTMEEASNYLGLSKATLYGYTHKKLIPFYKVQNRKIYFKIEDLNNFVLNTQNKCKSQFEIKQEADEDYFSKRQAGRK